MIKIILLGLALKAILINGKESISYGLSLNVLDAPKGGHRNSIYKVLTLGVNQDLIASTGNDTIIKIWNASAGKLLRKLTGHNCYIWALAYLDNGLLASGSGDRTIKIWDPNNGNLLLTMPAASSACRRKTCNNNRTTGHTSNVNTLAKMGYNLLASGSFDTTVRVWDTSNGWQIKTFIGHTRPVKKIIYLPFCGLLASASFDGTCRIWDPNGEGQNEKFILNHGTSLIGDIVDLNNGNIASTGHNKLIIIWNAITGQQVKVLQGHTDIIHTLSYLDVLDSNVDLVKYGYLVSGGRDLSVHVWNLTSMSLLYTFPGYPTNSQGHKVSIYRSWPFSNGLVLTCEYASTCKLWDIKTLKLLYSFKGHTAAIMSITYVREGIFATGSLDGSVRLWKYNTWFYKGCFIDNDKRDLNGTYILRRTLSIESCISYCLSENYMFAGLQYGSECYCGDSYGSYGQSEENQCNVPCLGNKNQICGARWRNNVYSTSVARYLGCYLDKSQRDVSGDYLLSQSLTIESCIKYCQNKKFIFSALQTGSECRCGNSFGAYGKADESQCNTACTGNSNEICGSEMINSVFTTGYFNGYYRGCFIDKYDPNRDLNGSYLKNLWLTKESCINYCLGQNFAFAGLQWGIECFCGNNYGAWGRVNDSECSMPCGGNSNVFCGNGFRNSVYYTGKTNNKIRLMNQATGIFISSNLDGIVYGYIQQSQNSQKWAIENVANGFKLRYLETDLYLETDNFGNVFTSQYNGNSYQIWNFNGLKIENFETGKALDNDGSQNIFTSVSIGKSSQNWLQK